jgi:hypothetical protein
MRWELVWEMMTSSQVRGRNTPGARRAYFRTQPVGIRSRGTRARIAGKARNVAFRAVRILAHAVGLAGAPAL